MKAIILLGAPGAGKGTLAENVRDQAGYIHVSTGDMLRAAIRAGSPTGLEAKSYMESGALVPDEVIMRIVRERLAAGEASAKYMFDGFPRTEAQARMLDETLAAMGARVDQVFLLDVAPEVIVKRLSGRRICRGCGAVYHVVNIPPKVDGVCVVLKDGQLKISWPRSALLLSFSKMNTVNHGQFPGWVPMGQKPPKESRYMLSDRPRLFRLPAQFD